MPYVGPARGKWKPDPLVKGEGVMTYERKFECTIRTAPASEAYREGWDRIFGKGKK